MTRAVSSLLLVLWICFSMLSKLGVWVAALVAVAFAEDAQNNSLEAIISMYANEERPMENGKLFEGDILPVGDNLTYNALANDYQLWPGKVIPYEIDYSLQGHAGLIQQAIQDYHSKTCLRFKRRTHESNYVRLFNGQGCYANVGMVGGEQQLSLGRGCHYIGTAVHELGHVAGFYHEHTRSDRDQHIDLYLQNVNPQYHSQFTKLAPHENRLFNRFDYDSVMLYGSRSFSTNGQYSMTRKDGGLLAEVHDKGGLSPADVERVNKLYKCSGNDNNGQGGWEESTPPPVPTWPPNPWGNQWITWEAEGKDKPDKGEAAIE